MGSKKGNKKHGLVEECTSEYIVPNRSGEDMMESVTIQDVYRKLNMIVENMATREDIEALIDTLEIVQHPEIMRKIRQSNEDIKAGRVKKIESMEDLLAEL